MSSLKSTNYDLPSIYRYDSITEVCVVTLEVLVVILSGERSCSFRRISLTDFAVLVRPDSATEQTENLTILSRPTRNNHSRRNAPKSLKTKTGTSLYPEPPGASNCASNSPDFCPRPAW